jgi:hypothetical protein
VFHARTCPNCNGVGHLGFDRGPAVEYCPECTGAGLTSSDPELRGVFAALLAGRVDLTAAPMGADRQLMLRGLARLEERIERIEAALEGRGSGPGGGFGGGPGGGHRL